MRTNSNGFKYYFDPEASSAKEDPEDAQEWDETHNWSQVERSKRGAPTKLAASA